MDNVNCKYFIQRKNRYCKLTVKKGREYCGEHLLETTKYLNASQDERIKCPYDPTHTCYLSKLEKHLKICNSKPKDLPSYLKQTANNCNVNEKKKQSLNDTSLEILQSIIQLIKKMYTSLNYEILEEILDITSFDLISTINSTLAYSTRKHLIQISSILGHIEKLNWLNDKLCFIEFGAGRGRLSYYLSLLLKGRHYNNCLAILIDKASHRHKYDNKLKYYSNVDLLRIKTNIADLHLQNIPNINIYSKRIGLTKHLCGAATAIQCITETCDTPSKFDGIIFTLCCHFRCTWSSYIGKKFLEDIGISKDEFEIMTGIASWATCGFLSKEKESELQSLNEDLKSNLNDAEKKEIGKMCKFLIDYGRMKALEKHGYNCKLIYYVKDDITPENVCLIAIKKESNDSI